CWRSSPARRRISARFGAGTSRHEAKAFCAAATARSTSSAWEEGKAPTTSSWLAGLMLRMVLPLRAATHSPPIRLWCIGQVMMAVPNSQLAVRSSRGWVGSDGFSVPGPDPGRRFPSPLDVPTERVYRKPDERFPLLFRYAICEAPGEPAAAVVRVYLIAHYLRICA